ncbi:hypothetical protein D3C76_943350 [compost metagenome]
MDIGNQRHLNQLLDFAEGFGGIHVRHRDADDIDAGIHQAVDLRNGRGNIVGIGVGHALYGDRCITADRHRAHPDFTRFAPFDRRFAVHDLLP